MRRSVMKGFVQNIEALATKNANFRRVLYTAKNCQLVVMSLHPAEEIGMEVHKLDQFFRVEEGSGEATDHPRKAVTRAMRHRGAFVLTTEANAKWPALAPNVV